MDNKKPKRKYNKKISTDIIESIPELKVIPPTKIVDFILPSDFNEMKKFISENKILMMEHVVSCVEYALKYDIDIIEVFSFQGTNFVVTLSKDIFKDNISHIYQTYLKEEIYEHCKRVKQIEDLLK